MALLSDLAVKAVVFHECVPRHAHCSLADVQDSTPLDNAIVVALALVK